MSATRERCPPDRVAGSASASPGSSRSRSAWATAASRAAFAPGGTANSRFSRTVMCANRRSSWNRMAIPRCRVGRASTRTPSSVTLPSKQIDPGILRRGPGGRQLESGRPRRQGAQDPAARCHQEGEADRKSGMRHGQHGRERAHHELPGPGGEAAREDPGGAQNGQCRGCQPRRNRMRQRARPLRVGQQVAPSRRVDARPDRRGARPEQGDTAASASTAAHARRGGKRGTAIARSASATRAPAVRPSCRAAPG